MGLPGHSVNAAFTNREASEAQSGPDGGPYLFHYNGFQHPDIIDTLPMVPAGIEQPQSVKGDG
jgi:hypothetical protein